MSRCWAFGPQGRCEWDGGHEGDHRISFDWTDEECLDPATYVPLVSLPVHDAVLVDQAVGESFQMSPVCFTCGCTEAAHYEEGDDGEMMCPKHQCRTYLP